jgi:hypothetical protein
MTEVGHRVNTFTLKDVLHVPNLMVDLVSTGKADDPGASVRRIRIQSTFAAPDPDPCLSGSQSFRASCSDYAGRSLPCCQP